MENLAPPERIFFWQNRIEFWQKKNVGPPLKMPQERLWLPSSKVTLSTSKLRNTIRRYLKKNPHRFLQGKANPLYSQNALMFDAVNVLAKALNNLDSLHTIHPMSLRQ